MWVAKGDCPFHGLSSEDLPLQIVAVLQPRVEIEEGVEVGGVPKVTLTTDAGSQSCKECRAHPFTILDAESLGLRPYPPIPKRCLLTLTRKDGAQETLDALDSAVSKEQVDLIAENYMPMMNPSRRSSHVLKDLRRAPRGLTFSGEVDVDAALGGLRGRLRACGLDDQRLMTAELATFPLLFWHVTQVTQRSEELCLIFARRLLQRIGQDSGREAPLPPLHEMPPRVLQAIDGLHAEILEAEKAFRRNAEEVVNSKRASKEGLERILKLRSEVESFDRDAYLEWGGATHRPCCAFNFFNVRGCASCMQAFETGHQLDALKRTPPDWGALSASLASLEEELHWMAFS